MNSLNCIVMVSSSEWFCLLQMRHDQRHLSRIKWHKTNSAWEWTHRSFWLCFQKRSFQFLEPLTFKFFEFLFGKWDLQRNLEPFPSFHTLLLAFKWMFECLIFCLNNTDFYYVLRSSYLRLWSGKSLWSSNDSIGPTSAGRECTAQQMTGFIMLYFFLYRDKQPFWRGSPRMQMSGRYVSTTKQISGTSITLSSARLGNERCTRRGGYIEISWQSSIIYRLRDSRANAIILMRLIPAIYHPHIQPSPSSF